jgi:GT2 family glycosyltransferase
MRASLLIAAHNEGDLLWKTISSCAATANGLSHEIIVVDDASTDDSVGEALRRFPEIHVARQIERLGAAPTKHRAAQEARGDVLIFLDGHTNPEAGSIARLVEDVEMVDGQSIITPAIPHLDIKRWSNSQLQIGHGYAFQLDTLLCRWLSLRELRDATVKRRPFFETPALIGCAFAISRELYGRLGGIDSDMRVWGVEDIDLGLKSTLMGHPILHDPQAKIGHRFRSAFDNYLVRVEHVLANQLRFARKHFTSAA